MFWVLNDQPLIRDEHLLHDWKQLLFTVIIPLVLVLIFAALIGLERQNVGKAAGLSAHILVGLSSAGIAIMQAMMYWQAGGTNNPDAEGQRVIAQVVTGVGFIGAGVIIKDPKNMVRGITTASTIWSVAMIGLILGSGRLVLGVILALTIISFMYIRDLKRGINPFKKLPSDHDQLGENTHDIH